MAQKRPTWLCDYPVIADNSTCHLGDLTLVFPLIKFHVPEKWHFKATKAPSHPWDWMCFCPLETGKGNIDINDFFFLVLVGSLVSFDYEGREWGPVLLGPCSSLPRATATLGEPIPLFPQWWEGRWVVDNSAQRTFSRGRSVFWAPHINYWAQPVLTATPGSTAMFSSQQMRNPSHRTLEWRRAPQAVVGG